jgi:hypothetical protein
MTTSATTEVGGTTTGLDAISTASRTASANEHRHPLLPHAQAASNSTVEQPGNRVDQHRMTTRSRTGAGADGDQTRPNSASTMPFVRNLKPEESYTEASDRATARGNSHHGYSGSSGNAPNHAFRQINQFLRRVATPKTEELRQHHDVTESTSSRGRATDKDSADKGSAAEGISAFLGRLLNQLSLSAWLPAAMLVGSLAVLLQLRAQQNRDVVKAVTSLANRPLGLLILLLFAIILATIVTQAFEFEVIRLLEGYWGSSPVTTGVSHIFVGWQRRKFTRLLSRRDKLKYRAFCETNLLEKQILPASKRYIVDLIKQDLKAQVDDFETPSPSGWRAKRKLEKALTYPWQQFAPADLMGLVDAVEAQIAEYPRTHRLLPTKLGNVLRAVEDSISHAQGEELEGFVMRHWAETPRALRKEHDQYRTRLDLYCMLVFVFLVLAILAPLLITLGSRYVPSTVGTSLAFLIMSFVSYAAAVASARGYGTALKAIAESSQAGKSWKSTKGRILSAR